VQVAPPVADCPQDVRTTERVEFRAAINLKSSIGSPGWYFRMVSALLILLKSDLKTAVKLFIAALQI
jgi:hypothetical protein